MGFDLERQCQRLSQGHSKYPLKAESHGFYRRQAGSTSFPRGSFQGSGRCSAGQEQSGIEYRVPGQVQGPLCPCQLHTVPFLLQFRVTVSWGRSSPERANPRVPPCRSAPVVCHSRPLCSPVGRAGPLLSAVTAAPRVHAASCTRTRGGGEAASRAGSSPPSPGNTACADFSLCDPTMEAAPPFQRRRGPWEEEVTTAHSWHRLSCSEDNLPLLCLPGPLSLWRASEESRKICRLG